MAKVTSYKDQNLGLIPEDDPNNQVNPPNFQPVLGETLVAAGNEGLKSMPTKMAYDYFRFYNDPGPKYSAEELNRLFEDITPYRRFEEAMSMAKAKSIAADVRDSMQNQYLINNGPTGAVASVGQFAAGVIPQFFDPLNIAFNIGVEGAILKGAAKFGATARWLKSEEALRKAKINLTATDVLKREGLLGVASATAIELPSQVFKRDRQIYETPKEIAANLAAGTAVQVGIGQLRNVVKRFYAGSERGNNLLETEAGNQARKGNPIDVSTSAKALAREVQGTFPETVMTGKSGKSIYVNDVYKDIDITNTAQLQNTTFFTTRNRPGENAASAIIGPNRRGWGVMASDRFGYVNGEAGSIINDSPQSIIALKLKDGARVMDLDKPVPIGVKNEIVKAFQKVGIDPVKAAEAINAGSLREFMDALNQHIPDEKQFDQIASAFEEALINHGYDAYKWVDEIVPGQQHNVIYSLKDGVLNSVDELDHVKEMIPQLSPEELMQAQKQALLPHYTDDVKAKVEQLDAMVKEYDAQPDVQDFNMEVDNVIETLQSGVDSGWITNVEGFGSVEELITQLKDAKQQKRATELLYKLGLNCEGGP